MPRNSSKVRQNEASAATVERVWVFPAAYVVLLAENTAVSDTLRRLA